MATVFGVLVSMATAYAAMRFNNIMDMLQLVFSFVNAPLFATFLLGMFWKRTTGHGAFWGLVLGTCAAALHYELTAVAATASLLPKVAVVHTYPSDMAQNFWGAIVAWSTCFTATAGISLLTNRKPDGELRGLVYGLTAHASSGEISWHRRPAVLAGVVLTLDGGSQPFLLVTACISTSCSEVWLVASRFRSSWSDRQGRSGSRSRLPLRLVPMANRISRLQRPEPPTGGLIFRESGGRTRRSI
jgi:hypothetical protein